MLALHVCFEQREVCCPVVLSSLLRWRLTSLPCERALLSLQGKTFLLLVDNSIAQRLATLQAMAACCSHRHYRRTRCLQFNDDLMIDKQIPTLHAPRAM